MEFAPQTIRFGLIMMRHPKTSAKTPSHMKILWLVIASLAGSMLLRHAQADIANRALIPLGERESFLANAGTGDADDTGAVYYNPAGLTGIRADKVSVLGSVYLSYTTKTDSVAVLDNTNIPYNAGGFNSIPVTFVFSKKLGDWDVAFSMLIPDSIQTENRASFTTPNTTGTILQSYRDNDIWLGLSAAHVIDSKWSVGVTLFGIQHSETNVAAVVIDVANQTNTFSTSDARSDLQTLGFSLDMGVAYRPIPQIGLGLRLQSPMIQVSGSANTYSANRSSVAAGTTEDNANVTGNYQLPLDMTIGAAFNVGQYLEFLTDLSLQVATTYDSIPNSTLNTHYDTGPTPRVNLGIEIKPDPSYPIRTGFFYNPSAVHNLNAQSTEAKEDYLGVTLGMAVITKHVETGVGVFYLWANGQNVPANATDQLANSSSSGFGGLLTTAYVF
jgi:hypothetical protein